MSGTTATATAPAIATTTGYHFFWETKSPFSQWHPSDYTLNGYDYQTAEQGMMHGKAMLFGDEDIADKILKTTSPSKIKALGREVKGFSDKVWKQHRVNIVHQNNFAKFTQNKHLQLALMKTSPMLLVEASPYDSIWGIGLTSAQAKKVPADKWKGLNLLGKILTRVREEIQTTGSSLPAAPTSEPASSPREDDDNDSDQQQEQE